MRINIITLVLFCCVFLLGGCTDLQGAIAHTAAWREEGIAARDALDDQVTKLRSRHESIDPGSEEALLIQSELGMAQAQRAALDLAITNASRVLEEAQHPSDSLTRIAQGVSSWVPAPAQGPIVLGAALVATLVRSRQLKQSAASIVGSISHVLERDDQFRSLFDTHADTIRSIQTPGARRMVDQTLRKRAGT